MIDATYNHYLFPLTLRLSFVSQTNPTRLVDTSYKEEFGYPTYLDIFFSFLEHFYTFFFPGADRKPPSVGTEIWLYIDVKHE